MSTHRDSARAAAEAAGSALRAASIDRADLLLLFATTPHGPGFTRVTRTAGEACGTRAVVGCSAAGVIAGEDEVERGAACAVLALSGDFEARRFFVPTTRGGGERAAEEIAQAVGQPAGADGILLLFADTYHLDADALFRGLARRMPGVRVIGGGASEDGTVGQVSVFCGDAVSSGAVSGVLLMGNLQASVAVSHALRRVGSVHEATGVDGRWLTTLDGRPAYEAFEAVVPEPLLADPRRAVSVVLVGLDLGDGDFVARHIVGLDSRRGAIAIDAALRVGQQVFFGVRDPLGAREELQRVLSGQAAQWETAPAVAGLYVNCVGRGRGFYGVPGLDSAYIRQHLGPVPLAGFFSGAEFAPGCGGAQVHQYTGVLALLGSGSERTPRA